MEATNMLINATASLNASEALETAAGSAMSLGEALIFISGTLLCEIMTIVGNIMVILSVFTYRPLRCVQNFYIVSLAVADILVAMCVMPFNTVNHVMGQWIFGEFLCNMWLTFDILMCTASILNLCAIAIDRYYAIHDPIRYAQKRTVRRVVVTIMVTWFVSMIISVPPLLGWNNSSGRNLYDDVTHTCRLTDEASFVIYSAMGSFYIPLFIMTFVYIKIFIATRRRLRKRARTAATQHLLESKKNCTEVIELKVSDESNAAEQSSSDNSPEATDNGAIEDANSHCDNNTETSLVTLPTQTSTSSGPPSPVQFTASNHHRTTSNGFLVVPTFDRLTAYLPNTLRTKNSQEEKKKSNNNSSHKQKGKKRRTINGNEHSIQHFMREKQRISLSKERKAARTMSIIMGVFVLCWLPFFLMYIIFPFCSGCDQAVDDRFINFIVWLGYINSALNPVIYTVFNMDFRVAFKYLMKCNYKMRR